jgi:hypothetical protein
MGDQRHLCPVSLIVQMRDQWHLCPKVLMIQMERTTDQEEVIHQQKKKVGL